MQLFRQQALDHQNRLHGDIFMVPPLRWQAIGGLLLMMTLAAMACLMLGSFTRTVRAEGALEAPRQAADADLVQTATIAVPLAQRQQLHVGQRVSFTVTGFPPRTYGVLHGSIVEIANRPADGALTVPVRVRLEPLTRQQVANGLVLRDRQPVEATVAVGRVPLWRWLFEPVLPDAAG